jgi:predicted Zn-dependent protease
MPRSERELLENRHRTFPPVVATHPGNGNAQYQLGKLLLDAGKVQEAVTHLEAAARALPQSDYVHYHLKVRTARNRARRMPIVNCKFIKS